MKQYQIDYWMERGEGFSERKKKRVIRKHATDEAAIKQATKKVKDDLLTDWDVVRVVIFKNREKIYRRNITRLTMQQYTAQREKQGKRAGFSLIQFAGP